MQKNYYSSFFWTLEIKIIYDEMFSLYLCSLYPGSQEHDEVEAQIMFIVEKNSEQRSGSHIEEASCMGWIVFENLVGTSTQMLYLTAFYICNSIL